MMEPTEEEVDVPTWTPQHQVYSWRWSQLWNAGYDSKVCELLAEGDADLNKMLEAKRNGLSDDQAVRIFA